jgi:hypothetical protein
VAELNGNVGEEGVNVLEKLKIKINKKSKLQLGGLELGMLAGQLLKSPKEDIQALLDQ